MLNMLFGGGLFTKIAMIMLFAVLVACAGEVVFKSIELKASQHKVADLQVSVKQLQTDNQILKDNVATITKVNEQNVETNHELVKERADAQAAIATLAKQKAANKKQLIAANKKIDEMLKDPKNNGTVAPVLRETIRQLQEKK